MNTPTPWKFVFMDGGGYDCMTDAFDIIQAGADPWGEAIASIDLSDYGQPNCKPAPAKGRATAEANAALIVRAVNSHQALIDALEAIVDIGARAVPAGYESFTDEQKKLYPIIYSEEAHVAQAALKLAKGEA